MIIREATLKDIPEIVVLLKRSLGNSLHKKSTLVWEYKHIKNIFGISYVLVALEDNKIIGVRPFMQWKWQQGDKLWQSYRAVDTATDPNHLGKGIFKKLTLQAKNDVQMQQECFIFNTPNSKSRPGYLKMGWQKLGKIRVFLTFPWLYVFLLFTKKKSEVTENQSADSLEIICNKENQKLKNLGVFFTPKSSSYLIWRYEQNQLESYIKLATSEWCVFCYVKKHGWIKELRIVEALGVDTDKIKQEIKQAIIPLALKHYCFIISSATNEIFSIGFYSKIGPMLTFCDLTKSQRIINVLEDPNIFHYSLGDLELF